MSFVVVNLNSGTHLKDTVNNLLSQTCKRFEIVIKDGGSIDGSTDFLKEWDEPRIKFVVCGDSGIYNAMNQAVSHCDGDFLWFVNAGDRLSNTDTLNVVYRHALQSKSPKSSTLLYGDCFFEDRGYVRFGPKRISEFFIFRTHINHQAQIWPRSAFPKDGFDLNYQVCADYEFFARSLLQGRFGSERVIGLEINYAGGGYSETSIAHSLIEKERRLIQKKYFSKSKYLTYRFLSSLVHVSKHCVEHNFLMSRIYMKKNPFKKSRESI